MIWGYKMIHQSVQFSGSVMSTSLRPLSITNSQSLLKLMTIESVMPSNHLILCGPLLLLPSAFPSIRIFSNESVLLVRWPKYWSFSFSIRSSIQYWGLISFRMDWLDLLAVQRTLKHLLQNHNSKPSFFVTQSVIVSIVSPSFCHEVMGPDAMILVFWMLSFKPAFPLPLSHSSRGFLLLLHFLP